MTNSICPQNLFEYFGAEDIGEGEQMRPVEWLVEGVLHKVGTGLLVGHAQFGKTQLLAQLAAKMVVGSSEFFGRPIVGGGGAVIVLAAERPEEMSPKIQAACHNLAGRTMEPAEITKKCVVAKRIPNLCDERERNWFIQFATQVSLDNMLAGGNGLRLVLIDTVSQAFPVQSENEAGQVGPAIRAMREISEKLGVFVLATHHPDASGLKPRGSSVYVCNPDVTLWVKQSKNLRELSASKVQSASNGSGSVRIGLFTLESFGGSGYAVVRETSASEADDDEPELSRGTEPRGRRQLAKRPKSSKPPRPTATELARMIFDRNAKPSADGKRLEAPLSSVRQEFFAAREGTDDAKRQRWSGAVRDLEYRHGFTVDLDTLSTVQENQPVPVAA